MADLVVLGLILAIVVAALVVTVLWFVSIVGSGAPFVPVPHAAVPGIVDALGLNVGSVVYDMGCGDGRILFALLQKTPEIRAVGIETAFLPYAIAKVLGRGTKAEIIHGDFFAADLKEATHVVLYLFPELMEKVEKKLMRELQPGTVVLAIDFTFNNRVPTSVILQQLPGVKRGTHLSLYTFS